MGSTGCGSSRPLPVFYAPVIIGGTNAPSGIGGAGISRLEEAPRLVTVKAFRVGSDIMLDGRVVYAGSKDCWRNPRG